MTDKDVGLVWRLLVCGILVCVEIHYIDSFIAKSTPYVERLLGVQIAQVEDDKPQADGAAQASEGNKEATNPSAGLPEQPSGTPNASADGTGTPGNTGESSQNGAASPSSSGSASSRETSSGATGASSPSDNAGTSAQSGSSSLSQRDAEELTKLIDDLKQESYDSPTLRLYQRRLLKILPRIAAGESVDTVIANANGTTALHNACGLGHYEIVKWLVDHGADCTLRTAKGADVITCIGKDPGGRIKKLIKSKLPR